MAFRLFRRNRLRSASRIMAPKTLGLLGLLFVFFAGSALSYVAVLDSRRSGHGQLIVEPTTLDLGNIAPGGVGSGQVLVKNTTDDVLRVIGFRTNCGCFACINLPLLIEPHAESILKLEVHVDELDESGSRVQSGTLLVDKLGWLDEVKANFFVTQNEPLHSASQH